MSKGLYAIIVVGLAMAAPTALADEPDYAVQYTDQELVNAARETPCYFVNYVASHDELAMRGVARMAMAEIRVHGDEDKFGKGAAFELALECMNHPTESLHDAFIEVMNSR